MLALAVLSCPLSGHLPISVLSTFALPLCLSSSFTLRSLEDYFVSCALSIAGPSITSCLLSTSPRALLTSSLHPRRTNSRSRNTTIRYVPRQSARRKSTNGENKQGPWRNGRAGTRRYSRRTRHRVITSIERNHRTRMRPRRHRPPRQRCRRRRGRLRPRLQRPERRWARSHIMAMANMPPQHLSALYRYIKSRQGILNLRRRSPAGSTRRNWRAAARPVRRKARHSQRVHAVRCRRPCSLSSAHLNMLSLKNPRKTGLCPHRRSHRLASLLMDLRMNGIPGRLSVGRRAQASFSAIMARIYPHRRRLHRSDRQSPQCRSSACDGATHRRA